MNSKKLYDREFYNYQAESSYRSAKVVVPLLLREVIRPESVVDVGCGVGAWPAVFREHGVERYLGLDGESVDRSMLLIPEERFRVLDLSRPFRLAESFDLAVSLELAEHLPPESAKGFVESITRLAPVILFSAAVPLQGGLHHINEQWPEYWEDLFSRHGFTMLDPLRKLIWQDSRVEWWYRQNIFLYVRNDLIESDPVFRRLAETNIPAGQRLTLIYAPVLEANLGLKGCLKRLPCLLWPAFFRQLKQLFKI